MGSLFYAILIVIPKTNNSEHLQKWKQSTEGRKCYRFAWWMFIGAISNTIKAQIGGGKCIKYN